MTNEMATSGIIFLTIFFIVEFLLVSYAGAGKYITSPEILAPPEPAFSLTFAIDSIIYFFTLFAYNGNFGIFNIVLLVPYTLMIIMYIVSAIRGN